MLSCYDIVWFISYLPGVNVALKRQQENRIICFSLVEMIE